MKIISLISRQCDGGLILPYVISSLQAAADLSLSMCRRRVVSETRQSRQSIVVGGNCRCVDS